MILEDIMTSISGLHMCSHEQTHPPPQLKHKNYSKERERGERVKESRISQGPLVCLEESLRISFLLVFEVKLPHHCYSDLDYPQSRIRHWQVAISEPHL